MARLQQFYLDTVRDRLKEKFRLRKMLLQVSRV